MLSIAVAANCGQLQSQEATGSSVTVPSNPADITINAPSPSPATTPVLPDLSALDQAFNQTGLGKDADELRTRVELRKLQNQVAQTAPVLAAKAAADAASTDLEKRERLKEYYTITYGLMAQKASTAAVKSAIEQAKQEHIARLTQPRVRPAAGEQPVPTPTPKKKKKHSGKRF
jgi:hypothetical protein